MHPIQLKYFKSSLDDTSFEHLAKKNCFVCGKNESPQILLDGSVAIVAPDAEHAETVCLDCLLEKKVAFEQNVEGGFLTKEGVLTESDKYPYLKESSDYVEVLLPKEEQLLAIDASKIADLMHTPPFRAYQGATWLIHCKDFMTYIGTWDHDDFAQKSPDGNAKAYFDQIVDNWNGDDFYDNQFGPDKSEHAESTFYAFECQHCKTHRGYVE